MGKLLRIMVWLLVLLVLYIAANVYVSYQTIYLHSLIKLFSRDRYSGSRYKDTNLLAGPRAFNISSGQDFIREEAQKMAENRYLEFFEDEGPSSLLSSGLFNNDTKYKKPTIIKYNKVSSGQKVLKYRIHIPEGNSTKGKSRKDRDTRKPNCYKLVSANDEEFLNEVTVAKKYKKSSKAPVSADWTILKLIQNCSSVHSYLRRYYTSGKRKDRISMAYAILLDRSLEQTFRFLQNIYSPDSIFCLHINMKAGRNYVRVIKMLAECVDNIVLPNERFRLGIQTIYKIHAQMACIRQLLNSTVRWSFLINLPGSAFPLRNQSMIESYLRTKDHSNEISSRIPTSTRFYKRTRFEHVFQEVDGMNIYMRTKKRKPPPPKKIVLFRGEEYFIATRQFSQFAIESPVASDFLSWATDTKNPEEFFWASLHRYPGAPGGMAFRDEDELYDLSPMGPELEDVAEIPESDLLLTLWKSDGRHKCSGEYRGNLCVYGPGDLRWIIAQDKLFASSFDFKVDRTTIDCLTMHLRRPLVEDHIVDYRSDLPVII